MNDTEEINIIHTIIKIKPKKILKICFFVITIPKEENLILNNLSCNDIDEYSDYNEDDYSDNEESEETIINRNKNNRKLKRKISRLALPKIKANKRDSSDRISKLKKK